MKGVGLTEEEKQAPLEKKVLIGDEVCRSASAWQNWIDSPQGSECVLWCVTIEEGGKIKQGSKGPTKESLGMGWFPSAEDEEEFYKKKSQKVLIKAE